MPGPGRPLRCAFESCAGALRTPPVARASWFVPFRLASTRRSLLLVLALALALAFALAFALALHFRLQVLEIGAARLRFNHDGAGPLPGREHDIGGMFNAAVLQVLIFNRRDLDRHHQGAAGTDRHGVRLAEDLPAGRDH